MTEKEAGFREGPLHFAVQGIDDGRVHAAGEGHGEKRRVQAGTAGQAEGDIARAHDRGAAEAFPVEAERAERF